MREPTFLIMTALAGPPLHGYAVIQEVLTLSRGRVRLRPGSLYGTLDRLLLEGLIEPRGEEVVGNRRRQYFGLTADGVATLDNAALRLADQAAQASARLRSRPVPHTAAVPS